jgi:hypothetical protein
MSRNLSGTKLDTTVSAAERLMTEPHNAPAGSVYVFIFYKI